MSNPNHLHHWSQVARSGQLHANVNALLLRQRRQLTAAFYVLGSVDRYFFFTFTAPSKYAIFIVSRNLGNLSQDNINCPIIQLYPA